MPNLPIEFAMTIQNCGDCGCECACAMPTISQSTRLLVETYRCTATTKQPLSQAEVSYWFEPCGGPPVSVKESELVANKLCPDPTLFSGFFKLLDVSKFQPGSQLKLFVRAILKDVDEVVCAERIFSRLVLVK